MNFNAQLIDQRIEGIMATLSDRFGQELRVGNDQDRLRSVAFVYLVATTVLGLDQDTSFEGVVEGGGDFGVDAVYFTAPEDDEFKVILIQGKYKRSLAGEAAFPENGVVKMLGAIQTMFNPNTVYRANDRLTKRIEELRSLIREGNIPDVRVILCNNGRRWTEDCQTRIDNSGLGDLVKWEHAGPDELVSFMRARKDVHTKIQLSGRAFVEDYEYMRAMIGRMSVSELARIFDEFGDVLLDRNIRRYLGLSVRVNESIAETLKDQKQRPNFYFFNNGITIICTKFSYNAFADRDWIVQVSGLQIVNGGQTSKTIQLVQRQLGPEIGNAQVLIRLYELPEEDEELVLRITQATNSQNPVDLRDLRSNDNRQQRLAVSIGELGYTYRRQRTNGPTDTNVITSATAAEAVLAVWRHRPHAARFRATEHFGKLYDQIFTPDLNGAQTVIAVLLLRFAENKRKRPPKDAPDFLQYGSRFIAMLMGMYLLEAMNITLDQLTHRNFSKADEIIDRKINEYFERSLIQIGGALKELFGDTKISLQKLSATFRRHDLVEKLRGGKAIEIVVPGANPVLDDETADCPPGSS